MTISTISDTASTHSVTSAGQPLPPHTPSPYPGPLPGPGGPQQAPIEACSGNAQVAHRPGRDVTIDVGAHMVITSEAAAQDLYRCLDQIFGPLAETRRAVARSVALAGDVR